MAQIIGLPKLSPTMEEGVLVRWTKKEGDKVAPGDLVAEVETDKANMDFNIEDDGVLLKLLVKEGDTVKLGAPVAIIGKAGEDVTALVADATTAPPVRGPFDGILVDAPCSGLGVLRRHPDIKWRKTASDLMTLQAVQLKLLHTQQAWLTAHGMLVYSVCSNEPEETHEVVQRFLVAHPHMRLDAVDQGLGQRAKPAPIVRELLPAVSLPATAPELQL